MPFCKEICTGFKWIASWEKERFPLRSSKLWGQWANVKRLSLRPSQSNHSHCFLHPPPFLSNWPVYNPKLQYLFRHYTCLSLTFRSFQLKTVLSPVEARQILSLIANRGKFHPHFFVNSKVLFSVMSGEHINRYTDMFG